MVQDFLIDIYVILDFYLPLKLMFNFKHPLVQALYENNLDLFRQLIDDHPELVSSDENSAIRYASADYDFDTNMYLIERGADIKVNRYEPLFNSFGANNQKLVDWLVQAGSDIHYFDDEHPAGLFSVAIYNHNIEQIDYLLVQGLDPNINQGYAIIECTLNQDFQLLTYLHGKGLKMWSERVEEALTDACRLGNLELVKFFQPHVPNYFINSTLMLLALTHDHLDVFAFLLENSHSPFSRLSIKLADFANKRNGHFFAYITDERQLILVQHLNDDNKKIMSQLRLHNSLKKELAVKDINDTKFKI